MDVTPQLLREVEFREQRRGYDQKEVDDLLERVAVAVGDLRTQLDEALERANRAERRVLEAPADEEELRRTLVLATRTAEATQEEARQRAADTVREAEEKAAAILADAEARAATVVGTAEARVRDELSPLLAQRDAVQRDVEALQVWAAEVRRRLTDGARQQLAVLEGTDPDLPAPPDVVRVDLPPGASATEAETDDAVTTVPDEPHGPASEGPYRVADGWDPTPPDVRVGERPPADSDTTAAFDTLGGAGSSAEPGAGGQAGATRATDDDPFLAELRRAVHDDEPLGPRDRGEVGTGDQAAVASGADDEQSSGFRRRRR